MSTEPSLPNTNGECSTDDRTSVLSKVIYNFLVPMIEIKYINPNEPDDQQILKKIIYNFWLKVQCDDMNEIHYSRNQHRINVTP